MDDVEKILIKSQVLISSGLHKKSLSLLKNSLKKYKNEPGILTQLSVIYELLGDYNKSKEMLENAIKSDPNYPRAHYIKGVDCQNEGNLKQAENEFQISIEYYTIYGGSLRDMNLSDA